MNSTETHSARSASHRVVPNRMIRLTANITVDPMMIGRYSQANGRLYIYSKGDALIGVIDEAEENIEVIHDRLNEMFGL
ncbi:MAG: hypothetical protein IR164_07645 [Devosia sp.]|uniref:hypothetical protein n=1 Tax=Devosia sp. TaxID=1871048 RepID=UPI0019E9D8E2|nr:hypothetical protein [Devosia sp.]MBF0678795.1 hypothetical protein [Devosia sp.]